MLDFPINPKMVRYFPARYTLEFMRINEIY